MYPSKSKSTGFKTVLGKNTQVSIFTQVFNYCYQNRSKVALNHGKPG